MNVTIPEGQEYGDLFYYDTLGNKIKGKYFYNLDYYNYSRLRFEATGIEPADTAEVRIRVNPTDPSIPGADSYVYVTPTDTYPIRVTLQPDTLNPGDTVSITLERNLSGNPATHEQFSGDQLFDVKIDVGSKYGTILNPATNDTADEFNNIKQGFKFIAAKNIDTSEAKVSIRVHAIVNTGVIVGSTKGGKEGTGIGKQLSKVRKNIYTEKIASLNKIKKKLTKRNGNKIVESNGSTVQPKVESTNPWGVEDIIGIGKAVIKYHTILLGESKYYQAKFNYTTEKMEIEEIKPDANGVPHQKSGMDGDCEWITSENEWEGFDVWGDNPVSILEGDNMGVYWERQKPIWGTDKILDPGLIRLVGRYWNKNQTYKVKLTTNGEPKNWGLESSIEIEVKRPKELGNKHYKELDVFGFSLNVDSLCIYNSGEIGVPPQIIKGHMEKETNFKNSFRYEPKLDINTQNNKSEKKKFLDIYPYYTVTDKSMGTIDIPDNHKNVQPVSYITSPIKIGDYLIKKITNYIRYPKKDKNGNWLDPFFIGYKNGEPSKKLQKVYNKMRDSLDMNGAMQIAIDSLKKWLKADDFKDGKKYVQSRIFSSYGMLQQVFYYACTDKIAGYAISNDKQTPESLNEIKYSIKAYKENMKKKIKNKTGNQWENGFEDDWAKILQNYNKYETDYGKMVVELSQQYLPK